MILLSVVIISGLHCNSKGKRNGNVNVVITITATLYHSSNNINGMVTLTNEIVKATPVAIPVEAQQA